MSHDLFAGGGSCLNIGGYWLIVVVHVKTEVDYFVKTVIFATSIGPYFHS